MHSVNLCDDQSQTGRLGRCELAILQIHMYVLHEVWDCVLAVGKGVGTFGGQGCFRVLQGSWHQLWSQSLDLAQALLNCVALDQLLSLSEPQVPL